MIEIATNGVFEENRKAKHGRDAKNGWYRYDTRFVLPVYGDDGNKKRNRQVLSDLSPTQ